MRPPPMTSERRAGVKRKYEAGVKRNMEVNGILLGEKPLNKKQIA